MWAFGYQFATEKRGQIGKSRVRNSNFWQFLFSISSKTFHKNKPFEQGLMVIGPKMTKLSAIEISKMDLGHPVRFEGS